MIERPLTAGAWLRLFVTLLAVICMLGRAVLPMSAAAHGNATLTADLRALGAALCHSEGGTDDPQPPGAPFCDHCPVCAMASDVPVAPVTETAVPPPMPAANAPPPSKRAIAAQPRAPPEYAHQTRAPPAI